MNRHMNLPSPAAAFAAVGLSLKGRSENKSTSIPGLRCAPSGQPGLFSIRRVGIAHHERLRLAYSGGQCPPYIMR
jgi:hypothetical protein